MAKKLVKYSVVLLSRFLTLYYTVFVSSMEVLEYKLWVDKQVDAFTDSPFKGNQAAVCLLEDDRDDQWLQSVAAEFNLSETCYLTRLADSQARDSAHGHGPSVPRFRLRWFTPVAEVCLSLYVSLFSFSGKYPCCNFRSGFSGKSVNSAWRWFVAFGICSLLGFLEIKLLIFVSILCFS